jgi:Zn-dependent oligopeptidase
MKNIENIENIENDSWKKLCVMNENIANETTILLERIDDSNKNILEFFKSEDINKIKNGVELLADSSYELNSYHKLCFLMKHVSPDEKNREKWVDAYNIINTHFDKNNIQGKYNNKLYNSITKILNNTQISFDEHEKKFLLYVIKEHEKRGYRYNFDKIKQNQSINMYGKICLFENKMENMLRNNNNKHKVDCLYDVLKLRNKYANMMGKSDYFSLVADIDINSLKITIKKILDNFKSINNVTIAYTKHLFELEHVVYKMFDILHLLFRLDFSKTKKIEPWDDSVEVIEIRYNNKLIGYLYIDLKKREGKFDEPNLI